MRDLLLADIDNSAGGRCMDRGADASCRRGQHLAFEYAVTGFHEQVSGGADMLLEWQYEPVWYRCRADRRACGFALVLGEMQAAVE
jgi:hypothetical protein